MSPTSSDLITLASQTSFGVPFGYVNGGHFHEVVAAAAAEMGEAPAGRCRSCGHRRAAGLGVFGWDVMINRVLVTRDPSSLRISSNLEDKKRIFCRRSEP